jgi:hypothetical protein
MGTMDIPDHKDCSFGFGQALLDVNVERPDAACFRDFVREPSALRKDRHSVLRYMLFREADENCERGESTGRNDVSIQRLKCFDPFAYNCGRQVKRLTGLPKESGFALIRLDKTDSQRWFQLSR